MEIGEVYRGCFLRLLWRDKSKDKTETGLSQLTSLGRTGTDGNRIKQGSLQFRGKKGGLFLLLAGRSLRGPACLEVFLTINIYKR